MLIKNGLVFTKDFKFEKKDILIILKPTGGRNLLISVWM